MVSKFWNFSPLFSTFKHLSCILDFDHMTSTTYTMVSCKLSVGILGFNRVVTVTPSVF